MQKKFAVIEGIFAKVCNNRALVLIRVNEAPRSKLRGIKAELRRSLTRLRSNELRRDSPCLRCRGVAEGEGESREAK